MAVKIGVLGAARITPLALMAPAKTNADVEIVAMAARDPVRATQFAAKYGIAKVHQSYRALLDDPVIDAIYNPLPNGLHGKWTIAAIEAGKHVLCEKPFTANAAEAEAVAAVARSSGKVVMEAFHYRYHALTARMLEIIASGELGAVRRIETWFCIPLFFEDIRWNLSLAGGSLMDAGCYSVNLLRTLAGAEPKVISARIKLRTPGVDRFTEAEVAFADGRTGKITTSMASSRLFSAGARVIGDAGEMRVNNPYIPQYFHGLEMRTAQGRRKESVAKLPSSYAVQLQAFADTVLRGKPFPTNVDDAIANMRLIDAIYRAAGQEPRQPSAA